MGKHASSLLTQTVAMEGLADAFMAFNTNYHDGGLFGVYGVTDRVGREGGKGKGEGGGGRLGWTGPYVFPLGCFVFGVYSVTDRVGRGREGGRKGGEREEEGREEGGGLGGPGRIWNPLGVFLLACLCIFNWYSSGVC